MEVVKYLIDKGANIEAKSECGYTALMWTSRDGHIKVVKYLIEIEEKDKDRWTALICKQKLTFGNC